MQIGDDTDGQLEALERLIVAPFVSDRPVAPGNPLRCLLNEGAAIAPLIGDAELERMRRLMSLASGEQLHWRSKRGCVGGSWLPEASAIPRLLTEARSAVGHTERNGSFSSRFRAAAQAGIFLVMVHPFSDGNGRMGRLVWARALRTVLPEQKTVVSFMHLLLSEPQRFHSLMRLANEGDPEPMIKYWTELLPLVA